jgi:HD-like signal output (HDOD) protein
VGSAPSLKNRVPPADTCVNAREGGVARGPSMKQQHQVDTDTVVLGSGYQNARTTMAALIAELERSLAERQLALPSLPEVALKIRKALADDNVSISEIVRLLGADPALAARILKVANSAMFYRGTKPIASLHDAVAQLGYKMVRNVALSFAAQQVFIGYGSRELRDHVGRVWQHSIQTAALAHMLARVRSAVNPDEAFLAGLLHEVGKLYVLMRVKDTPDVLADEAAFQSVLSAWHARLGRAVIEAWELSAELAVAVGEHESRGLDAPDPPTLTAVLAVANYFAEHSETARGDPGFHERLPSLGALTVDKPTFDWLIRAADIDVRLLALAFGV